MVFAEALECAELTRGLVAQEIKIDPVGQFRLVCLELLGCFIELV
jgi:hypothetical protein